MSPVQEPSPKPLFAKIQQAIGPFRAAVLPAVAPLEVIRIFSPLSVP